MGLTALLEIQACRHIERLPKYQNIKVHLQSYACSFLSLSSFSFIIAATSLNATLTAFSPHPSSSSSLFLLLRVFQQQSKL